MGFIQKLFTSLIPAKMYDNFSPSEFSELLSQDSDAIILDVRTPQEFASGHISGAINMDVMSANFQHRVATLDKQKAYYVVCRSGGRSARACSYLSREGFSRPHNLKGGMMAWQAAGKPISS